jgi:hypothetical protein
MAGSLAGSKPCTAIHTNIELLLQQFDYSCRKVYAASIWQLKYMTIQQHKICNSVCCKQNFEHLYVTLFTDIQELP